MQKDLSSAEIGENMNKKTILKWCLITLAGLLAALVVFVCFILFLLTGAREDNSQNKENDYSENRRRSSLTTSLKIGAEQYYKQHKRYPRITELYPNLDASLTDYLKAGVISYTMKENNFCVRYIKRDSNFQRPDQEYSMGWNGMQYCSKKEHLIGVSEGWQADGAGFYIHDLH